MDLTEGAISILLNSERQQNKDFKPVLQVTDIKLLAQTSGGGNSPDRYLVTLSDGTHTHHGMLATWRNDLVRSQRLRKGSVVQVSMFFTTVILNRRIIIILDLDMVLEKCDPIGDPKPLVLKGNASSSDNAKGSNLPLPNSEIMETMADVFKEKLAKKEASLRHTYKVKKKGREAAEQKLIDEQEANKLLCDELEVIKTNGPATLLASPPTFIETSPTKVFTEFKNLAEFEVVNRFLEPLLAEEPEKKKKKLVVRRRRYIYQNQQSQAVSSMEMDQNQQSQAVKKCLHCEITKTPQWRAGPLGPSTLCNACGVRFKLGRLFPEYRPAASPTFVPEVHSNSYKKVLQMRRTVIVNEKVSSSSGHVKKREGR